MGEKDGGGGSSGGGGGEAVREPNSTALASDVSSCYLFPVARRFHTNCDTDGSSAGVRVEPESTSGQKLKNMRDQGRGHARNAPATRHPSESSFSSTPPSSHLLPLCWGGTPFVRIYLLTTTPPDVMKSWSPWTGRLCRRVHAGRYCTPSSLNTCTGM